MWLNCVLESGAFNIVGGEVVTQFAFAKALASHLHKPLFMCLPARVIKLLFGQMGEELLLSGQDVKALRLHALGFEFSYPTLSKALDHLF
jgi:NAD dependent epimerase/dehydratase family enzyme